jgi:archaellum component FlaC
MANLMIERLNEEIYELHESIFLLSQRLNLLREEQTIEHEKILGEIAKMVMYHPVPSAPIPIARSPEPRPL